MWRSYSHKLFNLDKTKMKPVSNAAQLFFVCFFLCTLLATVWIVVQRANHASHCERVARQPKQTSVSRFIFFSFFPSHQNASAM